MMDRATHFAGDEGCNNYLLMSIDRTSISPELTKVGSLLVPAIVRIAIAKNFTTAERLQWGFCGTFGNSRLLIMVGQGEYASACYLAPAAKDPSSK